MAFGKKMAELGKKSGGSGDGEVRVFVSPWMPTGNGRRTFRYLPKVDESGKIVTSERINPATGNPLREGNKKSGAVLFGPVEVDETPFLFAWVTVQVNGDDAQRRIILDINNQWSNPYWKWAEKTEKGSAERRAQKAAFAVNVYDVSPVVYNDDGKLFYQDEKGQFTLQADSASGHLITDKTKLPTQTIEDATPLNQIRIFEGSYGKPNGRHLFQQLADLYDTVEDGDGMIRRLPEMTLTLTTKGSGIDTVRSVRNTSAFGEFPLDVARLPRYDLDSWLKPWPNEAVVDILEGRDFNAVIESYGIQLFPVLNAAETAEDEADFE